MKHAILSTIKYSLIIAIVAQIVACDSETDPDIDAGIIVGKTQQPPAGATFTFDWVQNDMQGKPMLGQQGTRTDSVAEIHASWFGRNNVTVITAPGFAPGPFSRFYHYEDDGDISELDDMFGGEWVRYPIQSKTPTSQTLYDSTINFGGVPRRTQLIADLSYAGVTTMKIYDSTIALVQIKYDLRSIESGAAGTRETIISTHLYYFAPSIGYFGKKQEMVTASIPGPGFLYNTLVRFTLP